MEKVYNLEEAEEFVMRDHTNNFICVRNGEEKEVECYPEAKEFFA